MTPPSTSITDVMYGYLAVDSEADMRSKIVLGQQIDALLRAGWPASELVPLAMEFATIGLPATHFAFWCYRACRPPGKPPD